MSRVAPAAITSGNRLVDQSTGDTVRLRGLGVAIDNCIGNTMYKTIVTLFHANYVTIRDTWADVEPERPTGGDPTTDGSVGTPNRDSAYVAKFIEMMDYYQANLVYFVVRTAHTGADGVPFLDGSGGGTPDWLYDDWYWDGLAHGRGSTHSVADLPGGVGSVAPLPRDRASYGGPYYSADMPDYTSAEMNAIRNNVDSGYWMPSAGDTHLGHNPNMVSDAAGTHVLSHTWTGDHERLNPYLQAHLMWLVQTSYVYSQCIGYNFFNEPDKGGLNQTGQMATGTNHVQPVHRMMRTQTVYYDAIAAVEPDRFLTVHGEGGHLWVQSVDFSIYWTSGTGGGGVCPSNRHFAYEFHIYMSGQDTYVATPGSYDTAGPLFNQNNLAVLPPLQQEVAPSGFDAAGDKFRLRWNHLQTKTADCLSFGVNATAAALQTALNALPITDPASDIAGAPGTGTPVTVTVTGPTNGPFEVLFPNTAGGNRAAAITMIPFGFTGCSATVNLIGGGVSGDLNNQSVYTPIGTNITDNVQRVVNTISAWGMCTSIGEYGIGQDVIDAVNYYTDVDTAWRACDGLPWLATFALAAGGNDGVLTALGGDTYDTNILGDKLVDLYGVAFDTGTDRTLVGTRSTFVQTDVGQALMPVGTQEGDYALIFVAARGASSSAGRTFSTPAGFSPVNVGAPQGHGHDSTFITAACFGGSVGSSETSSVEIDGLGGVNACLVTIVYRNCPGYDQVTITAGSAADTAVLAAGLTPRVDNETVIYFGATGQSTVTQTSPDGKPVGFTEQDTDRLAVTSGNLAFWLGTSDQSAAQAVSDKTWTTIGSGHHVGIMISVNSPASSGSGGGSVFALGAGIGQGHIDNGVIDGDDTPAGQDKAAQLARRVAGPDALLRCDFNFGAISRGDTFTDSYFNGNSTIAKGRRSLYTAIGAHGCRLYPTFHLPNDANTPPFVTVNGKRTCPEWWQAVYNACEFLGHGDGDPFGITPFASNGWKAVRQFEILNEPNGVSGGNMSPADCWVMIREAAAAIKSHAAANHYTAKIYGPALAGAANPITYIQQVQAQAVLEGDSLANWVNGPAIHCYWNRDPSTPKTNGGTNTVGIPLNLDNFQNALNALGLGSCTWVISEGGYSGSDPHNRYVGNGPPDVEFEQAASAGAGQAAQSTWLGGALDLLKSKIAAGTWKCDGIILYQIFDMNPPVDAVQGGRYWRNNLALANYTSGTLTDAQLKEAADVYLSKVTVASSAPTVVPVSPATGSATSQTTQTVVVDVYDPDGINNVECQVDTGSGFGASTAMNAGGASPDRQGYTRYSATVTIAKSASPGTTNHIRFRATDNSLSHLVSDWVQITLIGVNSAVDSTDPVLTVSQPSGDVTINTTEAAPYLVKGQATDNVAVASVTVNGLLQQLDASGNFQQAFTLGLGANPMVIIATDLAGNTDTISRVVTVADDTTVVDQVVWSNDSVQIIARVKERGLS